MEQDLLPNSISGHQNDDDDAPTLSLQALEALKEFLTEQSQSSNDTAAEADSAPALISEDWRMSQFWYDHHTAQTLAEEVLSLCKSDSTRVACVACPSLYAYLKSIDSHVSVQLLEYDRRFEQYGSDFTFYDYNQPEDLPLELKHGFDIVVADPPYLSQECLEKVAKTVSFLARSEKPYLLLLTDFTFYDYNQPEDLPLELKHGFDIVVADPPYLSQECLEKVAKTVSFLARSEKPYLLLLTGEVQKERSAELMGLLPCGFRPRHSSKLGNEFRLFTSYDPETRSGGWDN